MDTYEKKYNEALERARKIHRNYKNLFPEYSYSEDIETIFPQLRESEDEDERIRRTLVEYFGPEVQIDYVRGVPIQKIRDWLEKQKEQKQETISISEMVSKYRNTDEYDDDGNYKGKPVNCMIRAYEQGIRDTLSKVKEPNPAEWSKEDEGMLKWIEDILLIADDDLNDKLNGKVSPITDSAYSSMKLCIAKCLSWLKSLRPSWKPSDEQMKELLWRTAHPGGADHRI